MKRVCILYKRSDAQKNGVLINKYFNAIRAFGLIPGLVITDRLGNDEVLAMTDGAELVVNRTRDSGLAAFLELRGLRVTNPSGVCETANDKLLTYERLKDTVPMMETYPLTKESELLPFPFVAKPVGGHGGRGVSMIKNADELEAFLANTQGRAIMQPVATEVGRDMRVYVIGGKPVAAMLRESKTDFRSNFSLGGSAKMVPISELGRDELDIVEGVCSKLPLHYAGVDIMRDNGHAILNEIEDPVGARMLYIYTDTDPAMMHIQSVLQKELSGGII
ncbi:MAG: ATP-grasp domain-containing protein [Clostridia bacterium]|nr:ATP-grasp domain-containing protein [Clostridia bacterium]